MTKPTPPQNTAAIAIDPDDFSLRIDWDRYHQILATSDLSQAEQKALIETLWSIMVSFVDLGFKLHPLQHCGSNDKFPLIPEEQMVNLRRVDDHDDRGRHTAECTKGGSS